MLWCIRAKIVCNQVLFPDLPLLDFSGSVDLVNKWEVLTQSNLLGLGDDDATTRPWPLGEMPATVASGSGKLEGEVEEIVKKLRRRSVCVTSGVLP